MAEPYFDEDVPLSLSPSSPSRAASSSGASSPSAASEQPLSVRSHRPRGSRGRGQQRQAAVQAQAASSSSMSKTPKWRSGQVPPAPVFEGDVDVDPYCLRHYRKKLMRWIMITREFLPSNEQALRAREQLRGEAELELEEIDDSRYDHADGVQRLLQDLEESFGEKEIFRQGGAIREFEAIGRLQGETITAFIRRFRLLERKLQDSKVPTYPEQARVIKLLDGLRLDERAVSALLLAAGNRYEMKPILNAIKLHYPAGMSVTGLPLRGALTANNLKRVSNKQKHKRNWHTDVLAEETWDEEANEEVYDEENAEVQALHAEAWYEDDVEYDEDDVPADEHGDQAEPSQTDPQDSNVSELMEALTVTSKRLAELTKARGFFKSDVKKDGKGGNGKNSKGKGGFKGSSFKGSSKGSSKGKGKSKGSGKGGLRSSPMPTKANYDEQQKRIRDALCLGCGSAGHWLRECPNVQRHSAQMVTAGLTLDPLGHVAAANVWMTSASEASGQKVESVELPSLSKHEESHQCRDLRFGDYMTEHHQGILLNPKVLVQYANTGAALMIADTGCQKQVAGRSWHEQRQRDLHPLKTIPYKENCSFSFGPNAGVPSVQRLAYPSGIAGTAVVLGVSQVEENAPALFSRPSFELLGAVPDLVQGVMHYKALGKKSKLYLSQCGHLAIRVDEWPESEFAWPQLPEGDVLPDAWIPGSLPLKTKSLSHSNKPVRPPPHAGAAFISSNMVEKLALPDAEPPRVSVHLVPGGHGLCSDEHETRSQGSNAPDLVASSDCNHHVGNHNGFAGAVPSASARLSSTTGDMPARAGSSSLWSSRTHGLDMRPVRSKVVCDGDRRSSSTSAKSCTNGQNSVGNSGKEKVKLNAGKIISWLATGLSAALSTIAFTNSPSAESLSAAQGNLERIQAEWILADSEASQVDTGAASSTAGSGGQHEHLRQQSQILENKASSSSTLPDAQPRVGVSGGGRRGGLRGLCLGREKGAIAGSNPESNGGGSRQRTMSPEPLRGSADQPLLQEDRGAMTMRQGVQKRLLGNVKSMRAGMQMEQKIYAAQAERVRHFRLNYKCDLVEVYAGFGNITAEGLSRDLRVLQPIDKVHGISLDSKEDHEQLRYLLKCRRPFLTVWEIRCDPWSRIQHLNYTKEELDQLQAQHRLELEEMCKTIVEMHNDGCHFLLENPWGTEFWKQPSLEVVLALPGVACEKGAMCNFGLRGREGLLLKKETGWCSDLPEILKRVAVPCPGSQVHLHEECLGTNAKRGQIYTKKLAKAVIDGLCDALHRHGDERFCVPPEPESSSSWITGSFITVNDMPTWSSWTATTSAAQIPYASCWYLDIKRDEESWRPLLKEVEKRLQDKVQLSATVKTDTAFFEQINQLAPWQLSLVQIARTPKTRRLPSTLLLKEEITHRAAILLFSNGQIQFETEVVASILSAPGARFETPVAYAIFLFGRAPATTLEPEENKLPEASAPRTPRPSRMSAPSTPAPATPGVQAPSKDETALVPFEDTWHPTQPGAQDIHFPGLKQDSVPQWMLGVLRRLHVNLGHPGREALVRHLAAAGASGPALHGAKHLECGICNRTKPPKQPRPTKTYQARRFNDRVQMDIIYVKDVAGHSHTFLSQLDEATTYHVLDYLHSRSEDEVTMVLVRGWFKFFGFPDEFILDAEGAMKGFEFEVLCAQAGVKVRFIPSDAHWQLGKAERHGQAV